jgi:anti-sigma B factor antagonist
MDLLLSTTVHGPSSVVRVSGEIDLETATQLGDHAMSAIQDHGPFLVLDLGRVSFMDSTGLKVLISTQRRAGLAGGVLSLASVPRPVFKVLSVTGLVDVFDIYDDVDAAVAALTAAAAGNAQPTPD